MVTADERVNRRNRHNGFNSLGDSITPLFYLIGYFDINIALVLYICG